MNDGMKEGMKEQAMSLRDNALIVAAWIGASLASGWLVTFTGLLLSQ